MKWIKVALYVSLLAAVSACQGRSPVEPGTAPGISPGAGITDRRGGDESERSEANRGRPRREGGDDDEQRNDRAPVVKLSANPATVQMGQSSTLTWTSTNARAVTLDGVAVSLSGSRAVTPTSTKTYVIVAAGNGTKATASATVTVSNVTPPPAAKPTASLTATPASIQSGQSSTLSWTSANATSVTLDGVAVALNGSQVVSPTATKSYSLAASGAGGSVTTSANVTVTAPPPPPAGLTYTKDIQPIMAAHCTSCHSGSSPSAGINLSTYAGVAAAVTPGSASSRLVTATQPGGSMYSFLGSTATQLAQTIRSWVVDNGAKQ